MNIQHEDDGKSGRFFISEGDKDLAEMTYSWDGDERFIIEHTEVDPSLEGKGIGKALVAAGVEFAREKGVKILPACPYTKKVMERAAEYQDVLYKP
jgi:predicted GNAT family acetyltransferase